MDTSEEIIKINDDFQELKGENYYIKKNSNFESQKNGEEYEYSIPSNIIQNNKYLRQESQINESGFYNDNYNNIISNNYFNNSNADKDTDVDPNFADTKLKKEEEIRRRKEIEEFEKRTSLQNDNNNIIDFDDYDEVGVDEEGIKIDNSNYLSKIKKNNISNKNKENKILRINNVYINGNRTNNYNKIENENESEDLESKITQIKNNRINSYEKDDEISNNIINKERNEDMKIIYKKNLNKYEKNNQNRYYENNKHNNINNYLNSKKNNKKEEINDTNSIDVSQSKDYNMNFYDTNTIMNNSNKKANNTTSDVFQNLLPNKSFKKFLNNKIRYYMDEKDIPKEFINNLKINENINNNKNKTKNKSYTPNQKKNVQMLNLHKYNNDNILSLSINKYNDNSYSNYYNDENIESLSYNYRSNNKRKMNKTYYKSMKNFYQKNNIVYNDELNNKYLNKNLNYNSRDKLFSVDLNNNQKYLANYDKVFIENKINKEKIKNLKKELNNQKTAMNEKLNKINMLENMNDNLKNEMNKLQQNFEYERINNKETEKNYNMIKSNYTDIKNQYDLLNMKYITLSDENYNYRRDKDLYEKQIKTKNEMIENLLENNSSYKKKNINNKLYEINYTTKSSNEIIMDYLKNKNKNENNKNKNININNKTENKKQENENNKKVVDYNKFDKLTYPELQCKRDELMKERRDTNNIYSKIPLKSTSKEQINKRNMLEKKIAEINCDLMIVKLRIKNFNNHK